MRILGRRSANIPAATPGSLDSHQRIGEDPVTTEKGSVGDTRSRVENIPVHAFVMSCDPICRARSGLGGSLRSKKGLSEGDSVVRINRHMYDLVSVIF